MEDLREQIRRRVREKKQAYQRYNFERLQEEAFATFFDLAQEYTSVSNLYLICVAVLEEFFGLGSRLHVLKPGSEKLRLVCSSEQGLIEQPTERRHSLKLADAPYAVEDSWVFPIRGNLGLTQWIPFQSQNRVLGLLEIHPKDQVDEKCRFFLEKLANRIGYNLHQKLLIQQNIEQTKNLINRLCGYEPGTLDSTLGSRTGDVPVPASRLAIGVPTDAIRQRPDVRIAGYQLLSSAAQTEASYADRFPSLNLSGSLGMSSLKAGKLFDPQAISGSLAAGLAGPIFDAGRISANIEANEAGTDQALQNYRASILTALSEVEDALIACMRSGERLTIIKDATVLAREADRIARLQYEAGELDFLSVLDSQRTLLGLEDSLLSTQADRSNAYVSLYRAVGGGWNANR